jgi:prepilin-type N-terminal cleavage/methylation domain-containing protein
MKKRSGFTLVEVLIVIAIIGVLISLLLTAISAVRAASVRTQSANQLRQIGLATHNYASNHSGKIGGYNTADYTDRTLEGDFQPHVCLYSYLEIKLTQSKLPAEPWVDTYFTSKFLSPADYSYSLSRNLGPERGATNAGFSSYVYNMAVFAPFPNLNSSFIDGTATTILYAERLSYVETYHWFFLHEHGISQMGPRYHGGPRRASFADSGNHDVVPIHLPGATATAASKPGKTFQTNVISSEVECHILSSPYSWGLLVLMADGHVEQIKKSVSENAFWARVTRDAGDSIGE